MTGCNISEVCECNKVTIQILFTGFLTLNNCWCAHYCVHLEANDLSAIAMQ